MTMVLLSQNNHHPYVVGGCGGDRLMNGGGSTSDHPRCCYYYYCSCLGSDPYLIALDPPMAEDDSTTNSPNDEAPASNNKDHGWLQLSIGRGGTRRTSGLVELDLLPGGGGGGGSRDIPGNSTWVSDFLSREATTTTTGAETGTGIGMPLFFGTSSSSNFVRQDINWAFRPAAGVGIGIGMTRMPSSSSPSTSAASSSSFLPVGGRQSSYLSRPINQFQSAGVDAAAAGPSSDVRIVNPPRRPHSEQNSHSYLRYQKTI